MITATSIDTAAVTSPTTALNALVDAVVRLPSEHTDALVDAITATARLRPDDDALQFLSRMATSAR